MVVVLIADAIQGALSFTFIGFIIMAGPLEYGLARIMTATARGKGDVDIADIFVGFKEDAGSTIVLGLLKYIFICLWSILFVIPGIIASYAYSMSAFIQQDSPNKDWKYCIDESKKIMKGNKWKLFVLDLSFIGWYIVGALCFGVGVIFVMPYHKQARANFYLELTTKTEE